MGLQRVIEKKRVGYPNPHVSRTWLGFFVRRNNQSKWPAEHCLICLCVATYKLAAWVVSECLTNGMEGKWRCPHVVRRGHPSLAMVHRSTLTQLHLTGWPKQGCCAKVHFGKAFDVMRRALVVLALRTDWIPVWLQSCMIRVCTKSRCAPNWVRRR